MARHRKKRRTHVRAQNGPNNSVKANSSASRAPKSMVIRIGAGEVGPSVSQLVQDVRTVMEPDTAIRLKERKSNRLRDYTTMAGPLGVSHLLLFSRSNTGNTNMRLAITPRGPTLHFRVEKYSLSKDVQKSLKHPKASKKDYLTPPLLVMNNFTSPASSKGSEPAVPKHLESLTTTIFQSLFPPISPQSTPLASIHRVLLLDRELPGSSSNTTSGDSGAYTINFRHYAITTKRIGLSRGIRKLNAAEKLSLDRKRKGGIPNLGKLDDVADYLLDPAAAGGFTSGSESEVETDAEVEVLENNARKVLNKKQMSALRSKNEKAHKPGIPGVHRKAVKLVEIGPRMRLRMTKVEEDVCGGKVMWHEYINKSKEEIQAMEKIWDKRRFEKAERKRVQKENVERKRKERGGKEKDGEGKEDVNQLGDEDWDDEDFEDEDEMEIDGEAQGVAVD
ncbi:MAG: hypothetical protein Q9195_007919 [Heterodermia aff. obscurata]